MMIRKPLLAILLSTVLFAARGMGEDVLVEAFVAPPREAGVWTYWWWLNGYATKDGIRRDLDAMRELGINGALVFHAGNGPTPRQVEFLSPAWRTLFRFAVEEAAKRNIEIGLNVCAGWNAGGPWVEPGDAAKMLLHATVDVRGPADFDAILTKPKDADATYHDIAVLAWPVSYPTPGTARAASPSTTPAAVCRSDGMRNLTDKTDADGRLRWDVPKGDWLVVRFGWRVHPRAWTKCTGGARHLEIDPLSATAMDKQFAHTVGVVIDDVGAHAGKTFQYLHIDSGEIGDPDWTPDLRDAFRRRRGYDPLPYLAAKASLTVDSPAITQRFLEDYDCTLGDLIVERYHGRLRQLGERYGLKTHSEAAGYQKPGVDALRAMGANDIAMSEFWTRRSEGGNPYIHQLAAHQLLYHDGVRNAASAAHTRGRRIVQAEAYTVMGHGNWTKDPFALKDIGDRAFCAGLNRNVLCFMVLQPEDDSRPGYAWPNVGTNFDRHVTWWPMGKAWLKYLTRCQALLQAGAFHADACYFQGEWVPNYVPAKWAMDPPLPPGLDCDTVNAETLLAHGKVDADGCLVLANHVSQHTGDERDGMAPSYRYLVLCQGGPWQRPPREIFNAEPESPLPRITPAGSGTPLASSPRALRKLESLVEAGVTLVGPPPNRAIGLTDYPNSDVQVRQLAERLWGKEATPRGQRTVGAGRVIWGYSIDEVLRFDGLMPDIEIHEDAATAALGDETLCGIPDPGTFAWIHRTIDDAEVYFLANLRKATAGGDFLFRVAGKQPELWDAVTGKTRNATAFTQTVDGRTRVPLQFAPRESVFVVFRKTVPGTMCGLSDTNVPPLSVVKRLEGPWEVRFDPEWSGPTSVVFERLQDWTKRPEPGIRYYSGTATYRKVFDLPVASRDPGELVYLDLGRVKNLASVRLNGRELGVVWTAPWRVEITGALRETHNSLEIDVVNLWPNRLIGDAGRSPDKRLTVTNVSSYEKDSPLLESGLLGPVTLQAAE